MFFLADLKELSGKELVEKYGTHIMTDILLGGKFSAFYTGKYTSESSTQVQEFKASSNFLMSSITTNVHYDSNLFNSFKNVNIFIKTQGGSQTVTSIISQDPNGKLDNVSFDYAGWINSVTPETESLIGIGNPDAKTYLLSEFIDDPGDKKKVELALQLKEKNYELASPIMSTKKMYYHNSYQKTFLSLLGTLATQEQIAQTPYIRNTCEITLIFEDNYVKLRSVNNTYFDNNRKCTPNRNDRTQQWEMKYIDSSHFTLKNLSNNQYLSSDDCKFYNDINLNDSTFYWTLPLY